VSAGHATDCELRLYDRLFTLADPEAVPEGQDFISVLNPASLIVVKGAKIERSVAADPIGTRYQFERTGYFVSDVVASAPGALVFNRTVTLRDSWEKEKAKGG
jgi:glutaminyl-tRNA synthetase